MPIHLSIVMLKKAEDNLETLLRIYSEEVVCNMRDEDWGRFCREYRLLSQRVTEAKLAVMSSRRDQVQGKVSA